MNGSPRSAAGIPLVTAMNKPEPINVSGFTGSARRARETPWATW
jgi:hypothetical protein